MLSLTTQNGAKMVAMAATIPPFLVPSVDVIEERLSQFQHEREIRVARLAMLIECEGSITIGMTPPTKTRNRPALTPTVDITNTSDAIIDEARDTLISEGIGFSVKPQRYSSGFNGTRLRRDLNIHAFDRAEAVLRLILPFLRAKKQQAEVVLEFITSRRNCEPKAPYSDLDWQLTTQVRKLNRCRPHTKALAKAKAYLESPESLNHPRAAGYFRKYVEMCNILHAAL